jgi:hypothetical protein
MSLAAAGVAIRPELEYAWYGPSVLVTNNWGECGGDQTLSGFFFREIRFLRELRVEIDGQRPRVRRSRYRARRLASHARLSRTCVCQYSQSCPPLGSRYSCGMPSARSFAWKSRLGSRR